MTWGCWPVSRRLCCIKYVVTVDSLDAEDYDVDKGFVDETKEEEEDLALAVRRGEGWGGRWRSDGGWRF